MILLILSIIQAKSQKMDLNQYMLIQNLWGYIQNQNVIFIKINNIMVYQLKSYLASQLIYSIMKRRRKNN